MAARRKDPRPFIRVHDALDEHPKIEGLSDGAFRLLLRSWLYCHRQSTDGLITEAAWKNRGPVKARDEVLRARLAHLPGHSCDACSQPPSGFLVLHDYLDWQQSTEEIAELSEKRAKAGREGGNARARRQASATASAKQAGSKDQADLDIDTYPPTPQGGRDRFDEFWDAYPRKIAKPAARNAWTAATKRTSPDAILAGLRRYRFSADPQYVPHPATWLRQDRWEPEQTGVVRPIRPGEETSFTAAELDEILGPDIESLPAPPPGIDPEIDHRAYQAWLREQKQQRTAERVQQAQRMLTGARS